MLTPRGHEIGVPCSGTLVVAVMLPGIVDAIDRTSRDIAGEELALVASIGAPSPQRLGFPTGSLAR